MSYHVRGVGPDKAYYRAVQTVQTAVDEVRQCQKRVQRAKELLVDAQARSSASQRKARGWLKREERILEDAQEERDRAIQRCRTAYEGFRASRWAREWGLPQELADEVGYWVRIL